MGDGLWYKDAIIYQLHVKAFCDSTGDGIGDFEGLTSKLDYIQDLGVNAVWLLPFYPSPLRDDGYDISDYKSVNPAYGSLRDFRNLVSEAHRRGLRVITELVVNHTSDQHPWFQRARQAKPGSAWRNYYVWSDTDQRYTETRIIFTDTETSNWAWDPVANAYYWHRFFSHQPDLNFDNPRVLRAIVGVMEFWLDIGVDGLRLDAIPYLCEREGTNNENLPETHAVIKKIRAALDERYSDRMLLGEANQWPEDVLPYFGDGDECHMAFHFPLMPRIYMAVAQEDRHPITDIMRQTPEIPDNCQWAVFLRNHDELTLEMVTNRERDYLWNFFAADPRMRVNLGIRRRLAPLLDNDRRKIELLNSLLMSMPGTPIVYYGDEIGMGDNIYLGDRDAVRTPMQWSPDRNAGFSHADPARLYLPPIMDPLYGYEAVNIEAQSRSSSSLLNWMKSLIAARRAHLAFGRGRLEFLYPGNRKTIAYLREYERETILCVANLSRAPQPVELDLSAYKGRVPVELLGNTTFPPIGDLPYFITLPSYGFYWFLLTEEASVPDWHETFAAPIPELFTLVIPQHWQSLTSGEPCKTLQARVFPDFLANQRWFALKNETVVSVKLSTHFHVSCARGDWLLAVLETKVDDAKTQDYLLPLSMTWEDGVDDPIVRLLPFTLARVRKGAQVGVLADAIADEDFSRALIEMIGQGVDIPAGSGGQLVFSKTAAYSLPDTFDDLAIKRIGGEQSNSSMLIGDAMVLKLYRRLERGPHPEIEMGHHLTDVAHYPHSPRLLGSVEYVDPSGERTAIGILHEAVPNQGDGWTFTLDYLERTIEEVGLAASDDLTGPSDLHAAFAERIRTLGRRVAELHLCLARATGDTAFDPQPVTERDLAHWRRQVEKQARSAFASLRTARKRLPDDSKDMVDRILPARTELLGNIARLVPSRIEATKTRYHGDLHLGQVLVHKDDFYVIDFEGEPVRPMGERRMKHTPLRDVAGMLRSFSYAAWSASLGYAASRPERPACPVEAALAWEEVVRAAFLDAYLTTMEGSPSLPADDGHAYDLIELFELEKLLYEIGYEAAHRPNWLSIPLNGLLRKLETGD